MDNINTFVISTLKIPSNENQSKYWGIPAIDLVNLFRKNNQTNQEDRVIIKDLINSIASQFNCNAKRILGDYRKDGSKHIKYFRIQLKSNDEKEDIYLKKEFPAVEEVLPIRENSSVDVLMNEKTHSEPLNQTVVTTCSVENDPVSATKNAKFMKEEAQLDLSNQNTVMVSTEKFCSNFVTTEIPSTMISNESAQKTLLLPALNSAEMKTYAESKLTKMPERLKCLYHFQPEGISKRMDSYQSPLFITSSVRKELQVRGFATIKKLLDVNFLQEVLRYVNLKQHSENIDASAYLQLSGPRHTIGLVTKYGWTKFDYNGPCQQIIAADPNLYTCACELLGTTRLCTNFYEYKYNFPRQTKNSEFNDVDFEFFHTDGNYQQLLFADQAGYNVETSFYQFIVPLTPMCPSTATVYFAAGFHNHWREATYRALQANNWSRFGWSTCNPKHQFLPQDVQEFITNKLTPAVAEPGDVIIFNALLPHGPNVNDSDNIRVAAYPFFAPLIGCEDDKLQSFLPNSPSSVKQDVLNGTCPKYAAHPWGEYSLPKASQKFFSLLPYRKLSQSLLADCLFGFKSWSVFEKTKEAKALFGIQQRCREECVVRMRELSLQSLKSWNNTIEELLNIHKEHEMENDNCLLCSRLRNASLSQWWHSSNAVYHREANCKCARCLKALQKGWQLWNATGGCNCTQCCKIN